MPPSALDRFLPSYRQNEVHETVIAASPEAVLKAVDSVTAREIPIARVLLGIRSLPALLLGRPPRGRNADRPILEVAVTGGFIVLERSAHEVVLGVIGRFWLLATRDILELAKPEDFVACVREGYAKAAINFLVAQENGGTRLRTETRIQPLGGEAAGKFGLFWFFVHPGSALLRRAWLRAVRMRAETGA